MKISLPQFFWSALSHAVCKAVLEKVLSCPGRYFLEAAQKVGLTRCLQRLGAEPPCAWLRGCLRCSSPFEERSHRRSICSFLNTREFRLSMAHFFQKKLYAHCTYDMFSCKLLIIL